ncbi:MAG: hypothetical protein AAFY71_01765 [Bacteroidota bacterium]
MKRFLLLTFLLSISFFVFAQNSPWNVSLQLGYNGSRVNPSPYNFSIDSIFNATNTFDGESLSPARWGLGPTASIAFHRGRASFRLHSRLFFTQSNANIIENGITNRVDVSFWGGSISGEITSLLIDITDYFGFYVGAGISGNYFESGYANVPLSSFEQDDPLNIATQNWQVGFKLHTPFRVIIPDAHVGVSLEPYVMVFFSTLNLDDFNTGLNGISPRDFVDSMDHFGALLSVMFFLNR